MFVVKGTEGREALDRWIVWARRSRLPAFVELQTQYKNDLVVLGLSVDDPADKARA